MRYFLLFATLFFFTHGVSTKVFNDIESRYAVLKQERNALEKSQDSLQQSWDRLNSKWEEATAYLKRSRDSVQKGLKEVKTLKDIIADALPARFEKKLMNIADAQGEIKPIDPTAITISGTTYSSIAISAHSKRNNAKHATP